MSSDGATSVKEAYEQWDQANAHIKSNLPTQGWDYIKHAARLLSLLEPVSEINPIFKGECNHRHLTPTVLFLTKERDSCRGRFQTRRIRRAG